jgi:glycosyltransferase involved in cell wall biosynthesis
MSGPLRILYVNNSADTYGASRCLARICERIDRTRFEPIVVLPTTGPLVPLLEAAQAKVLIQPGLSVITRGVFKSWRLIPFLFKIPIAARQLRDIIRRHQVDLVHTNVGTILSSALGARLANVPHVWHIRDWYGEFRSLWSWHRKYIVGCSQKIVCVSRAIAEQFSDTRRVTVVHDGFPVEQFEVGPRNVQEFRQKYNIDQERVVVACIGRIKFVRKGQEFLVRAAAILRDQGVELTVLIVGAPSPGSEDHLPRLKVLIDELKLRDRVIFTGELADAGPAYSICDIVVLPSAQPEPFGGVVIEAMCAGKPVVATAVGGSLDQIVDGETGFLVPPADPEALAGKILMLIKAPELRKRMGEAGMQRARSHFNVRQMVEKLEAIYSEVFRR